MRKLTPELKKQIENAQTLAALEDLYAPYKSKRKTKGQNAIEAGLEPLAIYLEQTNDSLSTIEEKIKNEFIKGDIKTTTDAWSGAKFILMEKYAHHAESKDKLRKDYWSQATIKTSLKKDGEKVQDSHKFKDYFDFEQPISTLKDEKSAHRFLAVRRAMNLGILKVEVYYDPEHAYKTLKASIYPETSGGYSEFIDECLKKSISLYINPSLDLEIKTELKKYSDESPSMFLALI